MPKIAMNYCHQAVCWRTIENVPIKVVNKTLAKPKINNTKAIKGAEKSKLAKKKKKQTETRTHTRSIAMQVAEEAKAS